jgi:hypothetical protein
VDIGFPLQSLKFHRAGQLSEDGSFVFIDQWFKENVSYISGVQAD